MNYQQDILRRGTAVARGAFVLDQAQARKKLQEFQLVDPRHYVLEFIKVAHLLGTSLIDITIDADEFEMHFQGDFFEPREIEALHSAPFAQRGDARSQALRHLAIGVNAARGIGLTTLILEVGGEKGAVYDLSGEEVQVHDKAPARGDVTRIYLREKKRLGHALLFLENLKSSHPKVEILRERCRFSRAIIRVNGEQISGPQLATSLLPSHVFAALPIKSDDVQGILGLTNRHRMLETHVVHNGVLISTDTRPAAYIGAWAVIDSPRLTLNLSQSAFVEDDAWRSIQGILTDALLESLTLYLSELNGEALAKMRHALAENIVLPILNDFAITKHPGRAFRSFLNTVATLPLFAVANPRHETDFHTSIARARRTHTKTNTHTLLYARRVFEQGLPLKPEGGVLVIPPRFMARASHIFGHFADSCIDLTPHLVKVEQGHISKRTWAQTPWPKRPLVSAKAPVSQQGAIQHLNQTGPLEVSVTWATDERTHKRKGVEIVYVHEERLLNQRKEIDLSIDNLSIYLSGSFELDETLFTPLDTPEFRAAWRKTRPLLHRVLAQIPEQLRHEVMVDLVSGRFQGELTAQVGFDVWGEPMVGIEALGPLAAAPFIEDIHQNPLSLTALHDALEHRGYGRLLWLLSQYRGIENLRQDSRLTGELVIIVNHRQLAVIEALFPNRVTPFVEVVQTWRRANLRAEKAQQEAEARRIDARYREEQAKIAQAARAERQAQKALERARETAARERAIEENKARWLARPWTPPKPRESDIFHETRTIADLDVTFIWEGGDEPGPNSVVYVKEDCVLESQTITGTRIPGLHIVIRGNLTPTGLYEGAARTRPLDLAWMLAIRLIDAALPSAITSLDARERLIVLGDLVTGSLRAALLRAAPWDDWPAVLDKTPLNVVVSEIQYPHPRARITHLGLDEVMDQPFFEDIHHRHWSLKELLEEPLVLRVLATDNSLDDLRRDSRLGRTGHHPIPVIVTDLYSIRVLQAIFGSRTDHVKTYLDNLEDDVPSPRATSPRAQPALASSLPARPSPERLSPGRLSHGQGPLLSALRAQLKALPGDLRALSNADLSTLTVEHRDDFPDQGVRPLDHVLNADHPAITHAIARPDDPFALAMVSAALYDQLSRDYFETTRSRTYLDYTFAVGGREKTRFLDALTALLDDESSP